MTALPGFRIVDTYKAYKVRERKFLGWLKEASGRFKRSRDSTSPDVQVRINDVQILAQSIVARGQTIPEDIRLVLQDVISQRKEARAFYRPHGKADDGHTHYISVLEDALKAFDQSSQIFASQSTGSSIPLAEEKRHPESSNTFGLLDVEVVDLEPESVGGSENIGENDKENRVARKKAGKKSFGKKRGKARKTRKSETSRDKKQSTNDVDLLDAIIQSQPRDVDYEDDTDDLYFMIYCFFKDWNSLREYLQERWCDYLDGILGLSAVSLITNTAFELLQRSEQELLSQLPPRSSLSTYKGMTDMLFMDIGLAHVDYDAVDREHQNDKSGMDAAISEEADWLCLQRYWTLVDWLKNAPPGKIPTFPQHIGVPINYYAEGYHEKLARDERICHELLIECCLLKPLLKRDNGRIPGEDELTRGVITMLQTRIIPIWLIFAFQIQCDIRYILEEDSVKCHQELQSMGKRVSSILTNYIEFRNDFDAPMNSAIKTTVREVDCWITGDFMEPDRSKLHLGHGEDQSDIEPFYYLRRHPVLCGLMKFRFSLTMNELGLSESNQWGATIASAHLYNAIRHEDPEFPEWTDMEALIFIHSNQRIFWRDHLPYNPVQYSRSYERATGVSEMMEQRRKPSRSMMTPKKLYERGIGPVSVVSSQYHNRFCFDHGLRRVETLPDVEQILNESADNEIEYSLSRLRLLEASHAQTPSNAMTLYQAAEQESSRSFTSQFHETHALTNTQLLHALCTRVSQEAYTLNFDYFSFHTRCMHLLKAVYEEFAKEIKEVEGELDWGCGELPVVPHYIFEWMQDESRRQSVRERLKKAMEPIAKEQGTKEITALRNFFAGHENDEGRQLEE